MTQSLLIFGLVVVGLIGLNIYLSRSSWDYHPEGRSGCLRDMMVYTLLPVAPTVVCVGGFTILREIRPDLISDTTNYVLMGIAFVGLVVIRRLPLVVQAQARVQAARRASFDAMRGQ